MVLINSISTYKLGLNSIQDIKNSDFKALDLKPCESKDEFYYESKGFKLLNYIIKPKIIFNITFEDNKVCLIKLKNIEIKEISNLLKSINIIINVKIYMVENALNAERLISIEIKDKKGLLNFLPDNIIEKLLTNILNIVTTRFDKKFKNKILHLK